MVIELAGVDSGVVGYDAGLDIPNVAPLPTHEIASACPPTPAVGVVNVPTTDPGWPRWNTFPVGVAVPVLVTVAVAVGVPELV